MGVDHLGVGQERQETDKAARLARRQAKATLQNASIGRAGIRVYDGGWIVIENGGLEVEGLARVIGTLEGSGTLDWWGPWFLRGNGTIAGDQNVTGDTTHTGKVTINGAWKFVGNGEITGSVTLTGELTAGNMKISPSSAGGQISFGSNRFINAGSGYLGIYDGTRFVVFNSGGVAISSGGITISVSGSNVSIAGLPTIARGSANNATVGTVYMNTSGQMFRVVN